MNEFWKLILAGSLTVLSFDTLASFASVYIGFPYSYASIGSILIYAVVGYLGFRKHGYGLAFLAALLVESVDATLGWYISWQIGPGALPSEDTTSTVIGSTIVIVLIFAVICATLGAAVARAIHGARNA